jgi:N-acetylgalactosamine kinase
MTYLPAAFSDHFGAPGPTHVVHAPGRVNLVGDHIDYVGLSVLPMAIERRVTLHLRPRADTTVRVANTDPAYSPRSFEVCPGVEPYPAGDWGNYVKAAVFGLARRFPGLTGFDALVESDLPPAAGLSSSSALVVANALALLAANGRQMEPVELADLLADAERFVGTKGGGMDQAICLGAEEGSACRIDFTPLRLTHVPMPGDWRVVVASSLVEASKSADARTVYNQRSVECREAFDTVVAYLGVADAVSSYGELLTQSKRGKLLDAAIHLPEHLRPRFLHVVTEAVHVHDAEGFLRRNQAERFGKVMLASHASLRDGYEVSCAELDELAEIATGAGALGARLTGAGFGGCAIALATADTVDGIVEALRKGFYAPRNVGDDSLAAHLFVARPGAGAEVREC